MSAIRDIPVRDRAGLREFGLSTAVAFVVLFGLFLPWVFGFGFPIWPWVLAGILIPWSLVAPDTLGPVYRGWMRLALLLNRITTPVIMGAVFFFVITPVALLRRVVAKDPMAREFDQNAPSYRISSKKQPREKMEKPF